MLLGLKNKQFVFSRLLPKTGQTTSYQAGDDGDYEKGWSIGQRFIELTYGGDQVVYDRATGLMWAKDGNAAGGNSGAVATWTNAITYAEGLTFAGFSDWRLPNQLELASIIDYSLAVAPVTHSVFANIASDFYWSSTTYGAGTTLAFRVSYNTGYASAGVKILTCNLLCVRSLL